MPRQAPDHKGSVPFTMKIRAIKEFGMLPEIG
jgi:hypothetical protein